MAKTRNQLARIHVEVGPGENGQGSGGVMIMTLDLEETQDRSFLPRVAAGWRRVAHS